MELLMSSYETFIVFSPFFALLGGMFLAFAIVHIAEN
jgi:hypothetical protein